MWIGLLLLSGLLLYLALRLRRRAARNQRLSGLPEGKLVYADTGRWSAVAKPYFSERYRLTGKPDYLVETGDGLVPVEVKRSAAPPGGQAYDSHVMQLAAYCLLVEEVAGQAPPHGFIHYSDATVQIDWTDNLRSLLLETLDAMRADLKRRDVARSH
ncbi:MAG: Dna2/Cas4 domain-containing protein, partial [Caldilineales bacterium]